MRIALFTGGSGCATLIPELLFNSNLPDVHLTLIVNGYDNGKSTGVIRQQLGCLGPSDFRKNISRVSPFGNALERRVDGVNYTWDNILPETLIKAVHVYLDRYPNPKDMPLGNMAFAGLYMVYGDFNVTLKHYKAACNVPANFDIVNVSDGENLWLRAWRYDGAVHEEFEVSAPYTCGVSDFDFITSHGCIGNILKRPKLSLAALNALTQADMVIVGPGTQFSSILPSLATKILPWVWGLLAHKPKYWIQNLTRDSDMLDVDIQRWHRTLLRTNSPFTDFIEYRGVSGDYAKHNGMCLAKVIMDNFNAHK